MYKDILNMVYPNPEIEADFFEELKREAQFASFAALTGYDKAVSEIARITDMKLELDEYTKEELNAKILMIREALGNEIMVSITYFIADSKKSGGKYITHVGTVAKIKEYEKIIIFKDGTEVNIDDISEIESDFFDRITYNF